MREYRPCSAGDIGRIEVVVITEYFISLSPSSSIITPLRFVVVAITFEGVVLEDDKVLDLVVDVDSVVDCVVVVVLVVVVVDVVDFTCTISEYT